VSEQSGLTGQRIFAIVLTLAFCAGVVAVFVSIFHAAGHTRWGWAAGIVFLGLGFWGWLRERGRPLR
jgi:hypothetical protein